MSDLDNEEIEATKRINLVEKVKECAKNTTREDIIEVVEKLGIEKEKTADAMFEELGYIDYYETDIFFKYVGENKKEIIFNKIYKLIEYKHYEFDFIDMDELKAINKKCKELRLARLGEIMEIWKDIERIQ